MELIILKVKATSNVKALAGSIAHNLRGSETESPKSVELRAIGAGACNQAIKAIAISSGFIAMSGRTLYTRIGFSDTIIEDEEKTVMCFILDIK